MPVIAATALLSSTFALILAAPSGPLLALAGFFAGGTVGGLAAASAVALLSLGGARA